jgi:hypothetical protein
MKDVTKLSEENARILAKELDEATRKHHEFIRERDIRLGAADAQKMKRNLDCAWDLIEASLRDRVPIMIAGVRWRVIELTSVEANPTVQLEEHALVGPRSVMIAPVTTIAKMMFHGEEAE